MRSFVVYESMWGNTRQIAEAIAVGLGGARLVKASDLAGDDLAGLDLLVVGGPTHAFSMSRPSTRRSAREQGATEGAADHGLRDYLGALPERVDVAVATFDTRAVKARKLPGSAAKAADRDLRQHHHAHVVDRESFYVLDTAGPLLDGEVRRAQEWGRRLAERVGSGPSG